MTALLRVITLLLLISGALTAQAISPAILVTHLDSLYQHEVGDTAAIRTAYQSAMAPAAAPEKMHAAGWMSVYLLYEDPLKALKWANEALATAKSAGLDSLDYRLAPAYHTLGWLGNDNYGDSKMARLGLQIAPAGDHLRYRLHMQVAALLVLECDPFVLEALDNARQNLKSFDEETQEAELYGSILYEKAGFLYQCQENYRGSVEIYQEMLEHYGKKLDDPENLKAWVVTNSQIGMLLTELKSTEEAEQIMEELNAIDIDSLELETYDYANVQNALATISEALGLTEKAVAYQLKTLRYYQKHSDWMTGQEFIDAYLQLFRASMATSNDERTLSYLATYRGLTDQPSMRYYLDMSSLLYRTGQYQASLDTTYLALQRVCLDCAEGALPTTANTFESEIWYLQQIANLYYNATQALDKIGQSSNSELDYLQKSVALERNLFDFYAAATREEQGLFGESAMVVSNYKTAALNAAAARHTRLRTLTNQPQEEEIIFQLIESSKSSISKRELNPGTFPTNIIEENNQYLRALRSKEIELATLPKTELLTTRKAYVDISEAYQKFRDTLRATAPALMAEHEAQRNTNLKTLQNSLQTGDVFLHYIKTLSKYDNSELLVQAITPTQVTTRSVAIPADLDKQIAEYQRLIQSTLQGQQRKRQRIVEISHMLHEILIAPVSDLLKPDSRLIVSPDKSLYYVPFESLVEQASPAGYAKLPYLIKRYPISYHFSATDFVAARPAGAKKVGIAAFAPVFAAGGKLRTGSVVLRSTPDTLLRGVSGGILDPLPATRKEVANIKSIYASKDVLVKTDAAANRETLLGMLTGGYKVVHVATHGFVNEANFGLSSLACYGTEKGTADFVYAYDIRNQEVNAELVILSSCESGIGREVSGEGLLSLNRALIHAGAQNVISTLWKIDDRYSSEFMIKLHRIMASGESYAPALRQAKLQMLEQAETSAPRFWAPFVLVGS